MHLKKKKDSVTLHLSSFCSLWRLVFMQTCTSNDHTFTLRFIRHIKRKHAVACPGYKSYSRVLYIDADYNGTTSWHNYLGIHYIAKDIMCVSTKKKTFHHWKSCHWNSCFDFPLNRTSKSFQRESLTMQGKWTCSIRRCLTNLLM